MKDKVRKYRFAVNHFIGHAFLAVIGQHISLFAIGIVKHAGRSLRVGTGCGNRTADIINPVAALVNNEFISLI